MMDALAWPGGPKACIYKCGLAGLLAGISWKSRKDSLLLLKGTFSIFWIIFKVSENLIGT
jgi:hypothetical protein